MYISAYYDTFLKEYTIINEGILYDKSNNNLITINVETDLFTYIYRMYKKYCKIYHRKGEYIFMLSIDSNVLLKITLRDNNDNIAEVVNYWLNQREIKIVFDLFLSSKSNINIHYDTKTNLSINFSLYFESEKHIELNDDIFYIIDDSSADAGYELLRDIVVATRGHYINDNIAIICYKNDAYYIQGNTTIKYSKKTKQDIIDDVLYKLLNVNMKKEEFSNFIKLTKL